MNKENWFYKSLIKILIKLRIIKTSEVDKSEMCNRAQSICSHNCNSCAWNEEMEDKYKEKEQ